MVGFLECLDLGMAGVGNARARKPEWVACRAKGRWEGIEDFQRGN